MYFFVSNQIFDILISMEKAEYFCSYIIFTKLWTHYQYWWFCRCYSGTYKDFWKVFFLAIIILGFCRDVYVIVPTPTLFISVCNDIDSLNRKEKTSKFLAWIWKKVFPMLVFFMLTTDCWEISGLKKLQLSVL